MNSANMLAANKVKLHGMTSTKWTTDDKITQYKGLINLYTRDKKIIEVDNAIARKRQSRELQNLQKEIEANRRKLDNVIKGDKQKLRNTLADHKRLQLTYQNSAPQKVIDMVHQVNFTKRKMRDILRYRMKLKSDELIDLKLNYALYEDVLKYGGLEAMLPCELQAHLITGKVQDAILKKEAAVYIKNSYREMIAIMKKDAIYFDAVLISIKNDGFSQAKCMITATKLGQIGTEYLDDRRQEFQFLETIVKTDMYNRKKDLFEVQQNVENFSENLKNLIRRDSDINLGKIELESSSSFHVLKHEVDNIEETLRSLEKCFFAGSIEQLYPFLREQVRQKQRLAELMYTFETSKDDLLSKQQKATLVYAQLRNTMVDTTTTYNTIKAELGDKKDEQIQQKKEYQTLINSRYQVLTKVRVSLKHLQYLTTLMSNKLLQKSFPVFDKYTSPIIPEEDEPESVKIIEELTSKFAKLANSSKDVLTAELMEHGYKLFEVIMRDRSKPVEVSSKASEESLIETIFIDTRVPTHDDIKKQSEEIYARGMADLEFKPPPPRRKKYKFKK